MVLPAASLAVALRDAGVAALLLWAQPSPGVGLCSACRAVIMEADTLASQGGLAEPALPLAD